MRQIAPGTWRQRYLCCDWRRSGGARRTCSRSVQPRFDPPKMSGNLGAEGEKKRRGQKRAASEKGRRHVAREARTSRLAKQCCWQRGHSQSPSLPPWGIFTTEVSRTTSSVPPVCAWKASGNMAIASASMASSAAFWAAAAAALWPMLAARIAAWARGAMGRAPPDAVPSPPTIGTTASPLPPSSSARARFILLAVLGLLAGFRRLPGAGGSLTAAGLAYSGGPSGACAVDGWRGFVGHLCDLSSAPRGSRIRSRR